MSLYKKLEQELIDFLQTFDYPTIYDECKSGLLPYPLMVDLFSAALIIMEMRGKTECLEYSILGNVTQNMIVSDEDTCKVTTYRLRACLSYVEKLINPRKTSPNGFNSMYM